MPARARDQDLTFVGTGRPPRVGSVSQMTQRDLGDGGRLLWLGLAGAVVLEHVLVIVSAGRSPWWWAVLMVAAITVGVWVHRVRAQLPLVLVGTVVVAHVVWSLSLEAPLPISYALVLAVMSWLAGRRADDVRTLVALVVGGNLTLVVLTLVLRGSTDVPTLGLSWLVAVFWSLVFVVLPWLLGQHRQQQALLASAGWERAERAEHEQELLVEQARLRERAHVAQDMHDSLGHELSLIALRAGALELSPDLAQEHRQAASELRAAAATATEHLAEAIGILREDGSRAPLTPVDESVADLVQRAAQSGMEVRLVTSGAATSAPVSVRRTVHRVVREGLTNATKHAPGSAVTVRLDTQQGETTVSITNGRGDGEAREDRGRGYGLRGLAELLDLVGGTLRSGVTPGGGHELQATIPHAAVARAADHPVELGAGSSADERATAGRRARRGLLVAIGAPLVMGLTLGAVTLGYYAGISYASILDPGDYRDLRVGDARTAVEEVLPPLEMVDAPVGKGESPPPGSTCAYYRPDGPFSITFAYRLCFAEDTLVSKDVIQTGSVPPDEGNP